MSGESQKRSKASTNGHRQRRVQLACVLVLCLFFVDCSVLSGLDRSRVPRIFEGSSLREAFPNSPSIKQREAGVFWRIAEQSELPVFRAREADWVEIETELGRLRADWNLVALGEAEVLADIVPILSRAKREGLDPNGFHLSQDELLGVKLQGNSLLVTREGVALAVDPVGLLERSRNAHDSALSQLRAAIDALVEALPAGTLDLGGRLAAVDILQQLDKTDAQEDFDFVLPSYARRLVRTGWLSHLDAPVELAQTLESAVREAERLLPQSVYQGDGVRVADLSSALGQRVSTLSTPERAAYSRPAAKPAYYTRESVRLVVRVPRDADPLREANRFTRVEVFAGPRRIASWSESEGFWSDALVWRLGFPVNGEDVEPDALGDALPPHVLAVQPNGDVMALFTRHGALRPAKSGDPEDAERFYAEVTLALPDAAHLDLIGQYLLVYAYDSPDSRKPALIGTRQVSGDIHQTATETLDTQTGGMYRGDCDDLSELYQVIAQRQGHNAHLIGLPAHAALAWAEPSDEGWRTYVLQTGQPLAFWAETLPESLERVYRSFGVGQVFDLTKLEILLRFSGENTRSSWYLSHRIFSDVNYATRMVDIQRDWHFQTYQRAIGKVLGLIEDGDDDAANYNELAGLYRYTGQYTLAADSLVHALERTDSLETRVSMSLDRMQSLFEANRVEDAGELAEYIRKELIPELDREHGTVLLEPRMSLVDSLQSEKRDLKTALDLLANEVLPRVDPVVASLGEWLHSEAYDAELFESQQERLRYQLRWFASSAVGLISETGETSLEEHPDRERVSEAVWAWLRDVAFFDVEVSESPLLGYATLGRYYQALMSEEAFEERLRAALPPTDPNRDHTLRASDDAYVDLDFRWISISPPFWMYRLAALFSREHTTVDADRVAFLARRLEESREQARRLGYDHVSFENSSRIGELIGALVARDIETLRRIFRQDNVRNDRRIRLEVSSWVATAARFIPLDDYAELIDVWREEVNYKPMYFWIAWTAALTGATDHALLVAGLAANQFEDDPAFLEEYEFMKRRFKPSADPPSVGKPKPTSGSRSSLRESHR